MPEWAQRPYVLMLSRLEAEETQRAAQALLYAGGHAMADADRRMFARRLDEQAAGQHARRARAPRINAKLAGLLGVRPSDDERGKEVSGQR